MVERARRATELEPAERSPWAALVRYALGTSLYLSGETQEARKPLEEALLLTEGDQHMVRVVSLSFLALVATEEGYPEEAESHARAAQELVEGLRPHTSPQTSQASIALGRVLADRGKLEEARDELESGLSVRRGLPG